MEVNTYLLMILVHLMALMRSDEDDVHKVVRRKSRSDRYEKEADQVPTFSLGMEFFVAIEFRDAITKFSIVKGVKIV